MPPSTPSLKSLTQTASHQDSPLLLLNEFLDTEIKNETAGLYQNLRFAGYVLELGYDTAKIITADKYKLIVGGIPRGSFLLMTPTDARDLPPHFTLLRVTGVSPTPLSQQVQQTYFELHKRSMPELDVWTQGELQWGALDCDVLGMFYPNPSDKKLLAFAGDVNNVVSAHRYKVFAPDEKLLDLVVNGMVRAEQRFAIGALRTMECGLFSTGTGPNIPVSISMKDFRGCRTAMFGKTRLGKSNVVKLLAQGMLDATVSAKPEESVGQLIFDINGEYANDNPQDGNASIRSANVARCQVYALTPRPGSEGWSKPLRLNFYEQPDSCLGALASLLREHGRDAIYVQSFASVALPSVQEVVNRPEAERTRPARKILYYWAILAKAGFQADEKALSGSGVVVPGGGPFNPKFSTALREAAYEFAGQGKPPPPPTALAGLVNELEVVAGFAVGNPKDKALKSTGSGDPIFDSDDMALLKFFSSKHSGPTMLRRYRELHSEKASDFTSEILDLLDGGKTVILDLGSATDEIRRYFADQLSYAVFAHQEQKFVRNGLGGHHIQLYFEEAHNLFPVDDKDLTSAYARLAKEGAKFHIGMVYSTQSPSTINRELLAQTENFFVGHMSSQHETAALSKVQVAFAGHEQDILRAKTPGFMRMLTLSHRFVLPIQAKKFEATRPAT